MQQKWIATEEGLTSGEQIVPNHAWKEEGGDVPHSTADCKTSS